MNEILTEQDYIGYKKLYSHKQDLPSQIALIFLMAIFIIAGLGLIFLPLIFSEIVNGVTILFEYIIPIVFANSIATIIYDYNRGIKKIKKEYPNINIKTKSHDIEKMINEYEIIKTKVKNCNKIKEEMINENRHSYPSLSYNTISENQIEKGKVKVKTLTNDMK